MNDHEIEHTLERAKEIAAHYMPAWEGGFACKVINAIEELQKRNSFLSTRLHNEQCLDNELIFCQCKKKHSKYERGRHCADCGGAVEGIFLLEKSPEPGSNHD